MSDDLPFTDFPVDPEQVPEKIEIEPEIEGGTRSSSRLLDFWKSITDAGLVEPATRIGTHLVSIVLVLLVVWLMTFFYGKAGQVTGVGAPVFAAEPGEPAEMKLPAVQQSLQMPDYTVKAAGFGGGIPRFAEPVTSIPTRPRVDVITYTVQSGDSVIAIANMFTLNPDTILWSNTILQDNPHRLQIDQVLNIMPVNGTLHKWIAGENFAKVAEYYKVEPESIIEWPGNYFDIFSFDMENPEIEPGTMLIIPNGQRELVDYGPPRIPRDNPAVARTYGPGHCGTLMDGAVGVGSFIWPTTERWLSGYDYNPAVNHAAIDIAGSIGNAVWAADNGVIVYSGWSYSGYGNLIVIDHGNGWHSLYAHLENIYVGCGESVYQGTPIGQLGSTGNSSGPHLHFELMYLTSKVNPWDFLQ